jgi:hypothetical protein
VQRRRKKEGAANVSKSLLESGFVSVLAHSSSSAFFFLPQPHTAHDTGRRSQDLFNSSGYPDIRHMQWFVAVSPCSFTPVGWKKNNYRNPSATLSFAGEWPAFKS